MFCEKLTEEQIRKVMNVISDDGALTILKIRTYEQERYIECLPLSGKILVQLLPGTFDYSRSTFLKFGIPHPFQSVVHPGTMLFRPPVTKTEFISYRTK